MILELTLDPALDPQAYEKDKIFDCHTIYAKVTAVRISELARVYILEDCPIATDAFDDAPIGSALTIYSSTPPHLYCQYSETSTESGLNYIELPVTVKEAQKFPSLF